MGLVVVAMASSDSLVEPKKLHPFFTAPKTLQVDPKATKELPTHIKAQDDPNSNNDQGDRQDGSGQEDSVPKRAKRKTAEEADGDWEAVKKPRRGRKKAVPQAASIMSHFPKATGDESENDKDEDTSAVQEQPKLEETEQVPNPLVSLLDPPAATVTNSSSLPAAVLAPEDNIESPKNTASVFEQQPVLGNAPPKKVLQLNRKTGTIGSPPKPKASKPSNDDQNHANTDVPGSKQATKPTKLVNIVYGTDDASKKRVGSKIDEILAAPATSATKRKRRTRKPADVHTKEDCIEARKVGEESNRGPHPFFAGKHVKKTTNAAAPPATDVKIKAEPTAKSSTAAARSRAFSSTPCSPKKNRVAPSNLPMPQFGIKSLGLKTPGARLPAWPPKDMVHVRGEDIAPYLTQKSTQMGHARKCKGRITRISSAEMVLNDLVDKLHISDILADLETVDNDAFQPPPPGLRLPQKHFESGVKLEKRIACELRNPQHPALVKLWDSLATTLAAFDKFTCESSSWTHKYAPQSSVEVLQYGKEAFLLRDWLEALKVQSVDTGEAKPKQAKPPKKKRKKNNLDSFIVDDDEEDDLMDEVSDLEEDWSPDKRGMKKTVIRAGDVAAKSRKDGTRLTNAVVISGPHGCGKTAAVYAIAKELDFEIFEINAGSRRSGKDILEKIGDMTRNHLVQHHSADAPSNPIDEEEVAQDIKSGKQSTMNAFFTQKSTPQSAKPNQAKKQPQPTAKVDKKPAPKSQKQSLILLDEIDVLYDEDKQFWNTVMTLIAQSRRPFVMTCNDEDLVPLQALSLHGIFRFSAPPADLAVDRLLMIAAREGHALNRTAVEALYEARQQDMRACLMDLNYWCQIAVGDRRAGFDWFYPRWPKGCDVDDQGKVIRVISQDTYTEGLGWLGHDYMVHETESERHEEELLQEARHSWQMDVGDWHDSLDLASWAAHQQCATSADRRRVLEEYESFADALSTADLFSSFAFTASNQEQVDWTQPELRDKARDNFTLGRQLLDAPMLSTYDSLVTSLPITLRCSARKNLQQSTLGSLSSSLQSLDEAGLVARIRDHAKALPRSTTIDRDDFSNAFDKLAISAKGSNASGYLDYSVFDGVFNNIAVDIAPYVRGIISFEKKLQVQRQKLSSLLSQGGTKRRKTRASNAALEGGTRSTTRRDKWFDVDLNGVLVMQTGGEGWSAAVKEMKPGSETDSVESVPGPSLTRKRRSIGLTGNFDDGQSNSGSDMDADQLA